MFPPREQPKKTITVASPSVPLASCPPATSLEPSYRFVLPLCPSQRRERGCAESGLKGESCAPRSPSPDASMGGERGERDAPGSRGQGGGEGLGGDALVLARGERGRELEEKEWTERRRGTASRGHAGGRGGRRAREGQQGVAAAESVLALVTLREREREVQGGTRDGVGALGEACSRAFPNNPTSHPEMGLTCSAILVVDRTRRGLARRQALRNPLLPGEPPFPPSPRL